MERTEPLAVRRGDIIVTLVLMALAFFTVFVLHSNLGKDVESLLPRWGDYLATGLLLAPLAVRRRYPLTSALWIGVAFGLYRWLAVPEPSISSAAVFLAIFSAGAYSTDEGGRNIVRGISAGLAFVVLARNLWQNVDVITLDGAAVSFINVSVNVAFFAAAWILGDVWRQRQSYANELEVRADQLSAEREERARRAVVEERVRISRELHDVVAHHVSVMGVQAAGARSVLDTNPDRARAALEAVEESGRQAVSELQRLVGYLRDAEEGDPAPQPTLEDLESLISSTRQAGLPTQLRRIGKARPVPSSVELSAYRITQEALTNALKYAAGATTTVVLTYTESALSVEIVNEAPPVRSKTTPGGGRGMVGMRERTAILGGSFAAGAISGGGYRVAATLPTGSSYDTEGLSA